MLNLSFRIFKLRSFRVFIYTFQQEFCTKHISKADESRGWEKPRGYDTGIKIHNEILREKVPLILLNKGIATWYSCGPTVYADAHIGHASCYVKFDIIRRILDHMFGINVIMLMGITDIDDKIIKRAHQENCSVQEISSKYENDFFSDMDSLNVLRPSVISRVTEYIPIIISFCKKLIEKDFAYVTTEGNVYFRVRSNEEVETSSEFSPLIDPLKEDKRDFVLWKAAKLNEPFWPSPWSNGRPGWHIECSAMSCHIFGSKIDIHTGGYDLWFPHHSNENLQSTAYYGSSQWVNYWMHAGLLQFENDTKMSKSLGNTLTIQKFLKENSANVFRTLCLLSHYRTSLKYSEEDLIVARNTYLKLHNFLNDMELYISGDNFCQPFNSDSLYSTFCSTQENIYNDLRDDFNTHRTIRNIVNLITEVYTFLKPSNDACNSNTFILSVISSYIIKVLETLGINVICKRKLPVSYNNIVDSIVAFRRNVRLYALGVGDSTQFRYGDMIMPSSIPQITPSIQSHIEKLTKTLNSYGIIYNGQWLISDYDEFMKSEYVLKNIVKILDALSIFQENVITIYKTNSEKSEIVNKEILKTTDNFRLLLNSANVCVKDFKKNSLWYPLEDKCCDISSNANK